MKTGMTLTAMAEELTRRAQEKEDFLAPTRKMHLRDAGDEGIRMVLENGEDREFDVTHHTHRQLSTWAGVPAKYADRLRDEAPSLLATNMNHWLQKAQTNRMVRTLDGQARAFLSDRYRRVDSEDVAEAVLPVLLEQSNFAKIESCDLTPSRMYVKASFPQVRAEVNVGEEVQAGVIISNSEIGLGALNIQPWILNLVCTNGMVSKDYSLSKFHVGRRIEGEGELVSQLFSDDTLKLDDAALMAKVRDVILGMANRTVFDEIVEKMREATSGQKIAKPVEAVEVLAKSFPLNEGERQSVLESLIRGGDYSKWGAVNAVTATANDHESYDRATELEAMGGRILDLGRKDWSVIAEAA